MNDFLTIGICAHSYEGGSLCFLEACREGAKKLGPHMHPEIIMSAIPMGMSMTGWESGNHKEVAEYLIKGVQKLKNGGADFFICPDNTAHIVLEKIGSAIPLPGLHIADVVCHEIVAKGWKHVGLLGTKWTMTGSVYSEAFKKRNLTIVIPSEPFRNMINKAIFDELCQGEFKKETIDMFIEAIEELKHNGAVCVVLGCTEIPLIINSENSPLPILDSTRLLAKYSVKVALAKEELPDSGWINLSSKNRV